MMATTTTTTTTMREMVTRHPHHPLTVLTGVAALHCEGTSQLSRLCVQRATVV
jgi:hypothetical protein